MDYSLPSINFALPSIDYSLLSYSKLQESFYLYLHRFYELDFGYVGPEIDLYNSHFNSSSSSEMICMATNNQGESSNTARVSKAQCIASPHMGELTDITMDLTSVKRGTDSLFYKVVNKVPFEEERTFHKDLTLQICRGFEVNEIDRLGDNAKGKVQLYHETCKYKLGYIERNLSSYLDANDKKKF